MSDLAELLEDPAIARLVLDALVRDAAAQLEADRVRRRNGLPGCAVMPPQDLLDELGVVAERAVPDVGFASETDVANVGSWSIAWVTASEAADRFNISEQYARRLAGTGRVRHHRVGRTWLIDPDSLQNVLRRTA